MKDLYKNKNMDRTTPLSFHLSMHTWSYDNYLEIHLIVDKSTSSDDFEPQKCLNIKHNNFIHVVYWEWSLYEWLKQPL